ncbi:MAG: hypothetical protein R2789_18000 [Microthrixaceae bacterium]
MEITPEPTDEEAAAIVAAVTLATSQNGSTEEAPEIPRWRFSGRWWSAPVSMRRARP